MPAVKKEKPRLWKDFLNEDSIAKFSDNIAKAYQAFDRSSFLKSVKASGCYTLELKNRIKTVAESLYQYLPPSYPDAVNVLVKTAPHVGEFENWILTSYIDLYGQEYFEESINALKELTRHGTAEFAIRPFMIRYTDRMLGILEQWVRDPNEHVRRLAAEGSRPRGVWVEHIEQFKKDPQPVIKLLNQLKADSSLYVRKAVANNLNDISKDNPDLLLKTVHEWQKDKNAHTDWIIKRACRSLIKQGDPRIFPILGFTAKPKIILEYIKAKNKQVRLGSVVTLTFTISSTATSRQKLAIDYIIHYRKANGKTSPKVFKLTEKELSAGQTLPLSITHSFKNLNTRKHFPGKHRLEIVVNGKSYGDTVFHLVSQDSRNIPVL